MAFVTFFWGKKSSLMESPLILNKLISFNILQVSLHFHFVLYTWFLGERSRKSKRKSKIPASVSATYSSTVAEELLALIRKLHALEAWNPLVNEFISAQLRSIVTMVTDVKPVKKEPAIQVWFSIVIAACYELTWVNERNVRYGLGADISLLHCLETGIWNHLLKFHYTCEATWEQDF